MKHYTVELNVKMLVQVEAEDHTQAKLIARDTATGLAVSHREVHWVKVLAPGLVLRIDDGTSLYPKSEYDSKEFQEVLYHGLFVKRWAKQWHLTDDEIEEYRVDGEAAWDIWRSKS